MLEQLFNTQEESFEILIDTIVEQDYNGHFNSETIVFRIVLQAFDPVIELFKFCKLIINVDDINFYERFLVVSFYFLFFWYFIIFL